MKRLAATLALLSIPSAAWAGPPAQPDFQWRHERGRTLSLLAGEKTIVCYQFAREGGSPCVHPLALTDGTVLTEMAPADHAWHRAFWFSWKYLNGVNFWDWAGRKEPLPEGRTQPVGEQRVKTGPEGATISMDLQYLAAGKVLLREQRQIAFGRPRPDGSYTMDWRMTFTAADKDVVFDRAPPEKFSWGGYAGLSYRAAKAMRDYQVIDSEGRKDMEGHGKRACWMDLSGLLEGQGTAAGVAMFDHPTNPRHPTPWFIVIKGFGYFNPAFVFAEPYTLSGGKSLTLYYRVLVHPGRGDAAALHKEYQAFRAMKAD